MLFVTALFAVAVTPSVLPSPAPSATPLKTIGHVHSSVLCTTLRDNIFHSVEGLRINDNVIEHGRIMLSKMAYDSVTAPQSRPLVVGGRRLVGQQANHALEMDNVQLGQLVQAVAKNLNRVDALLSDAARFPAAPTGDDQKMLAAAKNSLQAVVDQQKVSLNILSGTLETTALQMLLAQGDNTGGTLGETSIADNNVSLDNPTIAMNSAQANATTTGTPAGSAASSSKNTATSTGAPTETSLFANNTYGRLSLGALFEEKITQARESAVLPAVLPIVNDCR